MWTNVSLSKRLSKLVTTLNLCTDTKELTRECVGGSDLQQRKKEIEAYNEQTSSTLKQTCKKNYMQFIQTAKEISRKWSQLFSKTK